MTKSETPHVVVVGAGLAGLSCAIACADGGARVTVLESKPRVGGATWSFDRHGLSFDNGQHVFLRCCTAYRRFLERIGTTALAPLQDRLSLPVISPTTTGEPKVAWIKSSKLPAPAHLLPSLFSYSFLTVGDRMRLGGAVRALQKLRLDDPSIDDISFSQFLEQHGQRHGAIEALWDLIVLPTVNLRCDQASLTLAAKVFKTGLLENSSAADIGWARVPLAELHGTPAVKALENAGGVVRTSAKVTSIDMATTAGSAPHATGVTVDGEHLDADAVVLAVPHEQAGELLPAGGIFDPSTFAGLGRSPIIDVHVVYDRKVMDFDIATGLNTPVQYVFDRTDAAGMNGEGQCLAVSVSNADAEHGERPEVLIERYTKALAELFPKAREAKIIDAVVSREHAATFRGVPGTQRLRPHTTTGFDKLFLAGAWLDTGWPATMEGAVRSGIAASSSALGDFCIDGERSLEEVLA